MISISDWRINFFDLGAWPGHETQAFLDAADTLREGRKSPVVAAYLIEAHPGHAIDLQKRFEADPRVFVTNCAIGLQEQRSSLSLGAKPECHSLYPDKHDVTGPTIDVNETRFSAYLRSLALHTRNDRTINVIKANIEGAEWDLIQDLEAKQLWGLFDLYLGADQWTADMQKCHSLLPFIAKARSILDLRGITVKPFCMGTTNYPSAVDNVDLAEELRRLMA